MGFALHLHVTFAAPIYERCTSMYMQAIRSLVLPCSRYLHTLLLPACMACVVLYCVCWCSLVSESMAMLPGSQLVHSVPSESCGTVAVGEAHTPQSRGQHRQTSFQRSLTAKNPHSGPNSSPRRRSVEKAVGGMARAGGVLGSRPGSSAQGSTRFLQGPKRRETDELSEVRRSTQLC